MSDDGGKSLLANPLPIVMVMLLAAGVLVKTVPLRSARPTDPERAKYVPMGLQDVEARLWQDPFAAVDKVERTAGDRPAPPAHGDRALQPHTAEAVGARIEALRASHPVTVLAVSVFGSSYAEAAESRRRTRFAVVSALGFHGYRPDNPEAIGYFRIALPEPGAAAPGSAKPGARPLILTVPYEWFERRTSGAEAYVLVLWLNEDKLTASPLEKLRTLFADLTSRSGGNRTGPSPAVGGEGLSLRMVGPAGSAMLAGLVRDRTSSLSRAEAGLDRDPAALQVFAPGATISNCELFQSAARGDIRPVWDCFVHSLGFTIVLDTLAIVRTTGTDDVLAAALLWELAQRGVNRELASADPWYVRPWGWLVARRETSVARVCADGLVLINEWDTEYGRALLRHLTDGFSARCRPGAAANDRGRATPFARAATPAQVRTFAYLRGLDGALSDQDKSGDGAPAKDDVDKTKDLRAQLNDVPREHAEGRSQYDYLRRLADEIARLDGDPEFARHGVKAIGIVGSDVYDKLLILQALRGRFQDKIFFTTDLDARYLHADQKDWARNLVVASNFGLSLRPALQQATLPFRDSYQTATYLAALMALDGTRFAWSGKISEWLRPQLFEIGRTEAVHLASPSAGALAAWITGENPEGLAPPADDAPCRELVDPTSSTSECRWWADYGNIDPARPRRQPSLRTLLMLLAMITFAIGLIALASRRVQAMVQAARHAPDAPTRTLKRAAAIAVIGVVALVLGVVAIVGRALDASLAQGVGEPFLWLEGVSVWPSLVLRFAGLVTTIALAAGFTIWMRRQTHLIAERFELGVPRTWRLARSWWSAALIGPHLDLASFDAAGNPGPKPVPAASAPAVEIATLWRNYLRATSPRAMAAWIALSTLVVLAFGFIAFQLLGVPAFPHRGRLVETLHRGLVLLTTGSLWLVIFWVGYESRAGARFIQTLSDVRSVWPAQLLESEEGATGVPSAYLDDYLDFQLVAAATRRIYGLIYLPFVSILFLVVARSDLFDAMDFPLALIFVTGLALAYALYTAVLLRRSAEAARARALEDYETRLLARARPRARAAAPESAAGSPAGTLPWVSSKRIRSLMDRIRGTREGAFAPFTQQPAVQALLLPFGGYGGVQLIEYLINLKV